MDISLIKPDLSIFLFSESMFLTKQPKTGEKHVLYKKYSLKYNVKTKSY